LFRDAKHHNTKQQSSLTLVTEIPKMEVSNGKTLMPTVQGVYFLQNFKYSHGNITMAGSLATVAPL
jgi:hypothetical protein